MSNLGFDINIENILFGNASFENDKNSKLFLLVQKYIVNSKRFVHKSVGRLFQSLIVLGKKEL
jgi:hypothetical protein